MVLRHLQSGTRICKKSEQQKFGDSTHTAHTTNSTDAAYSSNATDSSHTAHATYAFRRVVKHFNPGTVQQLVFVVLLLVGTGNRVAKES